MAQDGAFFVHYLDRKRDVFLSAGDFRPLHLDLDLHLLSIGVSHDPFVLKLLQDGLSALALYQVSRPRFETFGWTISLQSPRVNLFFTGSTKECTVVGRAFLEGVQPASKNLFFTQVSRPFGELQTSSVEVRGTDVWSIVEQYSMKSDQHLIRYFRREDERVALVIPFPDADRDWLKRARAEEVFELEKSGDLKVLSDHLVRFHCGCDGEKINEIIARLYRERPEDLFRGEPSVEVECPRCGAKYGISRGCFDKALSANGEGSG
jgi:molecular chaperone Hsp33